MASQRFSPRIIPVMVLYAFLQAPYSAQAACTSSDLKALLLTDADSIGTFIPANARQDNTVLAVANQARAGSTYAHSKGTVTRDQFLGTWADVIQGVRLIADAEKKAKWEYLLDKILLAKDTIDYTSAQTAAFFTEMIADGLYGAQGPLTTEDIAGRTTRQGSWAELRCGSNLTLEEISAALNLP